jgi:hypothetical protein
VFLPFAWWTLLSPVAGPYRRQVFSARDRVDLFGEEAARLAVGGYGCEAMFMGNDMPDTLPSVIDGNVCNASTLLSGDATLIQRPS